MIMYSPNGSPFCGRIGCAKVVVDAAKRSRCVTPTLSRRLTRTANTLHCFVPIVQTSRGTLPVNLNRTFVCLPRRRRHHHQRRRHHQNRRQTKTNRHRRELGLFCNGEHDNCWVYHCISFLSESFKMKIALSEKLGLCFVQKSPPLSSSFSSHNLTCPLTKTHHKMSKRTQSHVICTDCTAVLSGSPRLTCDRCKKPCCDDCLTDSLLHDCPYGCNSCEQHENDEDVLCSTCIVPVYDAEIQSLNRGKARILAETHDRKEEQKRIQAAIETVAADDYRLATLDDFIVLWKRVSHLYHTYREKAIAADPSLQVPTNKHRYKDYARHMSTIKEIWALQTKRLGKASDFQDALNALRSHEGSRAKHHALIDTQLPKILAVLPADLEPERTVLRETWAAFC